MEEGVLEEGSGALASEELQTLIRTQTAQCHISRTAKERKEALGRREE